MKDTRPNKLLVTVISILVLCLIAGAVTVLILHNRELDLEKQQNEALQELYDKQGQYDEQSIVLSGTTRPRAEELAKAFGAELRITEDGSFATLTLPEGVTVFDIYENEEYRKYIEYMSLDYQAKISDLVVSDEYDEAAENSERLPVRPQYTVSDTDYNRQTYLDYLNMGTVWSETKGSGITVAVIDTGIDTDHPEFAGRISEYSYNASEDKIVKDYLLEDGAYDWSLVEDEQGHGTAVAGVIAAAMDGNGIVGIAPQVNIIVIKAECDENGTFKRSSDLVFGLYYAIERDVAVVNMSFGGTGDNPYAEPAQLAFDSDIICVAAAGNEATADLTYPAADENIFGVGALASDSWELASYSNYGENVNFVAPGTVYTTKMGGEYGVMNGTSFSSPITAGVLALYLSQNKYQEFNTVEELLYASCYDLGDLGPDWYYGYGALDVSALMLEGRGTVTFNMMTDELDNTDQVFIRNHTLQNMPEPERLYAIFDGWYYDPQCTDEYNWYVDEFYSDLTLYANWVNEEDGVPYTYVELEDGTIEIRSYTGHRRYITIPDYIDGKVVSSIGEFAFAGETRLREVNLPKYLKRIRMSAFDGCSNLVSMAIPDTVTEIGENAFRDNVRLSALTFGQNSQLISIGDFAFSGCAKMRTFTVPSKVTTLNGTAFYRNTSIIAFDVQTGNTAFSVMGGVLFNYTGSTLVCYPAGLGGTYTVPENVRTIGNYAFACTRLSGVELSKVQTLGNAAFVYGSLENIVIPDSVTDMGKSVFANNLYMRSATLGAGLTSISVEAFCSTSLTSIEIPAGIRSINESAFASNLYLAEVTFAPNSTLTDIGTAAFSGSGVVSVEIPASVIVIGYKAFSYNLFLSSVSFGEKSNLRTIGSYAFACSLSLTEIVLPASLTELGNFAFMSSALTDEVYIPASLSYFGAGAFASCGSLTTIAVDAENPYYNSIDGVVYTEDGKCLVAYPAGNERVNYTIPEGVTDVGEAAFYGSYELEQINFASTVTAVREYAFYGCANITRYELSDVLTYIEAYAFSMNYSLRGMSMPDSLMQISNYAFAEDWSLSSVTFTENAKLPRISYGAFAYCGLTSFRVPANVSTMAQKAFLGCSNLTSFTFAKNSKLESISAYMFDGCSGLRTITFETGSALTSIQAHGLDGLRNLYSIDFGDAKLTNIDNFAFRFCESLTRFDIPEGVTSLGRYAFYDCIKLAEITVPTSVEHIGRFAFLGTNHANVYFAAETLPVYLQEDWDHGITGYYLGVTDVTTNGDWKYAKLTSGDIAIIEYNGTATEIDLTALDFGGKIVNIGGEAFAYSTVENITLPETLVTVQNEAFYHSNLKSVTIPASVQFIGRSAFADTPIRMLTFAGESNLTVMEQSAFEGTKQLQGVTLPASLTTMGRAVFKNSGITSLSFENGFAMTEIPEEAFAYTKISTVTIPDSVTVINHDAFREIKELSSVSFGRGENLMIMSNVFYQSGLESVYIPENVGYVGEYAFVALSELKEFKVAEGNPYYKAVDGLLVSKNGRKLISVPAGRTGSLTVPEDIEVIGFGAFENSRLSEIKFLDGANILSFGYRAFYNADGITEMHIPTSVVAIDYYAFAMCDNLQDVTFAEDNNLKGVYEGAFYGCKNLSDITLPDSIVEISDFAFYGCRKLTEVPVSETNELKGIYDYAFAYAGLNGDFTTPETLIDIGAYAFMGNKLTSVTIPDTNAYDLIIGIGAFEDCRNLTEITVPFIGASFEDPDITWFGYIFGAGSYEANNTYVPETLKKVTVSEGITFVGTGAFSGLTMLEEMSIPHSVALLEPYAFNGTTAKYELTNTILTVSFYDIFGTPYYEATKYNLGAGISGHLELADGVTSIESSAFENCASLTSITIPNSVTSIGNSAFWGCSSLTSVTIPDSVTSISAGVFSGCSSLTSITIPSSVTSIGDHAFSYCSLLTSITIPSSVTSIGDMAFYRCENLYVIYNDSDINLSIGSSENGQLAYYAKLIVDKNGNKTYKDEASGFEYIDTVDGLRFMKENGKYTLIAYLGDEETVTLPKDIDGNAYEIYQMRGVRNVIIPEGVTSIGYDAFYGCSSLTSITIPEGVTSIGNSAFYGCSSLMSITLPDSVTSIGDNAFRGCTSLTSITIPDSVTSIYWGAFSDCSSMTSITIPDRVTYIDFETFCGCSSLTSITIPDSVTSIGDAAFSGCSSLTSITIPDSVTSIGGNAFRGCTSLTSITIPNSVTSIGTGAFANCPVVIYISESNNYFKVIDGVVYNKEVTSIIYVLDYVTELVIPATVSSISSTFECKANIEKISFAEGSEIKSIGDAAFSGCTSLTSITIPESVTSIDYSAFSGCSSLTNITIPDRVTYISTAAFSDCSSLTSITIPDRVTYISNAAFKGCSSLTSITIPNSVTSIGDYAFRGCTSLTSITIPDSVTSIGWAAFSGCSSLTNITIPDSVTSIGYDAFYGCSSLMSITIPYSVTSIGDYAFSSCFNLYVIYNNSDIELFIGSTENGELAYYAKLIVDKNGNKTYRNEASGFEYIDTPDGFRFMKENDAYKLIAYLGTEDTVTLPKDINGNTYEIYQMCGVKNVIIPDSVTSIGEHAFSGCSSLMSITIPNSVTSIGDAAFSGCSSLTSITIPDDVTSIGEWMFSWCNSLTSITIPDSVTSIGNAAFSGCSSLTSITIPDSVTFIGGNAFNNTAYYNDPQNWDNGTLYIGNHLIKVSEDAVYCEVRKGTRSIADGAFDNCFKLKKLTIGGNHFRLLSDLTNLETLIITEMPTQFSLEYYFDVPPITLKSIVLTSDVRMTYGAFYGFTGITIYVEANEKDVRWDENFLGWSNGNRVVYGDKWLTADFYDKNGDPVSSEIFLTSQIIRQPYAEDYSDGKYLYVFSGYDIDGDGIPDTVPATSKTDITAYAVFEKELVCDKYGHTPGAEADCINDQICTVCSEVLKEKLGHDYSSVVTAPTCTEAGYATHTCSRCGDSYTDSLTEALGHTPGAEADCLNDQICTVCSEVLTKKLGHDYVAVVTEPTCTKAGYTTHTCSRCGDSYTDSATEARGHKPGTEADCLNDQICTVCREVLTEKLGHNYAVVVTAPTCTEAGYTTHTCSRCGDSYTDSATETLGHMPGAEADCLNDQICTVCREVLTEKLGHDYVAVVTAPTCTEAGYTTHTCSRCGGNYTDSVTEALGHDWADADCTTPKTCEACGETDGEALGHKYGEWTVTKEATETEKGSKTKTCACGDTVTEEIPMLEKEGLLDGAITGIVIGSVAVVGLGGFSLFWFVIKKKK